MAAKKSTPPRREKTAQRGPRTQLTPELAEKLLATHRENCDFPSATAAACNVKPDTFARWIRMGQAPDAAEPYRSFACDFLQAEAEVRALLIRELRAADNHHQANAIQFLLSRRFSQFKQNAEGTLDVLDMANEQRAGLTPEQKRQVIERMLASPTAPVLELLGAAFRAASPALVEALAAAGFQRIALPLEGGEDADGEESPEVAH